MKEFLLKSPQLLFLLFLSQLIGCVANNPVPNRAASMTAAVVALSESELETIKADVTELVLSYSDAMNALDEQDILSHVIKSPNFAYTRRGTRSNIEQFKTGTRNLTKSFINKEGTMSPVMIDLISPEVAVATFTFEQTLTTTAGELRDFEGTVTWIAIKEDGEWRYIHGLSY